MIINPTELLFCSLKNWLPEEHVGGCFLWGSVWKMQVKRLKDYLFPKINKQNNHWKLISDCLRQDRHRKYPGRSPLKYLALRKLNFTEFTKTIYLELKCKRILPFLLHIVWVVTINTFLSLTFVMYRTENFPLNMLWIFIARNICLKTIEIKHFPLFQASLLSSPCNHVFHYQTLQVLRCKLHT